MAEAREKHWTQLPDIELAYFLQILLPPLGSLWLRDFKTSGLIILLYLTLMVIARHDSVYCLGVLCLWIYSIYSISGSYRKLSGAKKKPKPIIIHGSDSGFKWWDRKTLHDYSRLIVLYDLITTIPATINPIPIIAPASKRWLWKTAAINAIPRIPTADQIAYAIPTGISSKVWDRK